MSKKLNFEKGLFIVLGLIISLLAVLSFLPQKSNNRVYGAGDDTTTSYSFEGSNVVIPTRIGSGIPTTYSTGFALFSVDFDAVSYSFNLVGSVSISGNFDFDTYSVVTLYFPSSSNDYTALGCLYYVNSGFNANIFRIDFGYSTISYSGSDLVCNFVKYVDVNDNYFAIYFTAPNSYGLLDNRSYYVLTDISNNEYYNQGYNSGFDAGKLVGSQSGYNDGYSAGESVGYNNGYSAGASAGATYTFNSLFGAVLDAPIQTLTGLLNFNLLGVNLLGLFTGLLTLAVIVFIVKLALGGK